jgi:hypothetical protein
MKCANPNCNRNIGLISYRRGWSAKRRYCSRQCRDAVVTELPNGPQQDRNGTRRFAWLFLPPAENARAKLTPGLFSRGAGDRVKRLGNVRKHDHDEFAGKAAG